MSDGQGCDAGSHHCGIASASGGGDNSGFGTDGRTPVPDIKRATINGAPIVESSHEYVIPSSEKRPSR